MATARNRLNDLMTNPGSFSGSPGFDFALKQGQQAIGRSAAARGMRGSGNVLAELMQHGVGAAQQDYGNEFNRRFQAAGLEQDQDQFGQRLGLDRELGQGQLSLGRDRLGLDRELGRGQLELGRGRLGLDRDLGMGQLDLGRGRLGLDTMMGAGQLSNQRYGIDTQRRGQDYDFDLGSLRAGMDYDLGGRRLDNERDLGFGRLDVDRYNAGTARGTARSQDWQRREQMRRTRPRNPWTWEPE